MLLRHYLEQGTSKSALARKLGVHRDTIHRWIRAGELDRDLDTTPVRYGPRRPVPTKLDAYKAIIDMRLAAYPALSAVRLLAEIRAAGFAGSYTQLKAYVRQVRPTPPPEPVIRFETPAGRQAQVDFARFSFSWGVRYALLVVLGYSRLLWCRFYVRQDMRTLIDGLEDAFRYFGGVPQELLFDQMKAVITRDLRLQGGRARAQSGVAPLRSSLGLHGARVSTLSRADQGQGRASGPLSPRQFRLRPDVCQ
ncbi:MAG TPA: IS21 family transposase [Vicinamibacterales bacterium]|nr:IS21 family transposase [Vicinamibacterales bacterium]